MASEPKLGGEGATRFFWQTPGSMLPYVVALLLLLIGGKDNYGAEHMAATSFDFRLLLGLGAGEVVSECV